MTSHDDATIPTRQGAEFFDPRPVASLVEVLLHELSNPVQAARMMLNLLQADVGSNIELRSRLTKLDLAFDRIAMAVHSVQSVKEAALRAPTGVNCEQVLNDLRSEFSAISLPADIAPCESGLPLVTLHEGAIPVLIARWVAANLTDSSTVRVQNRFAGKLWTLHVVLRKGLTDAALRELGTNGVAGFAAAIYHFMIVAGGSASIKEDSQGEFELNVSFATWSEFAARTD